MDRKSFEERVARVKEVAQELAGVDELLRPRAFELFVPYITSDGLGTRADRNTDSQPDLAEALEPFFSSITSKPDYQDEPAANVLAIAAWLYQRYGTAGFTTAEIADIAAKVGLTVPSRIDMTLVRSMRGSKALFRKASGKGRFEFTVTGETTLKKEFDVSKGRAAKPEQIE